MDNSEERLARLRPLHRTAEIIQADIRDRSEMITVFSTFRPQIVFHTAALKHLAPLESDPFSALETNVVGTLHLMECAMAWRTPLFVNASTDKAVNPTSMLGISKRICELLLLGAENPASTFISVRLGNVLGSSGSVVPLFIDRLHRHQPLRITHRDAARYFMAPEEVMHALTSGLEFPNHSLLLPDMDEERKIVDLGNFLMNTFAIQTGVEYTGLQAGEKCREQLKYEYEYLERTDVRRLSMILGNNVDGDRFSRGLVRLLSLIYNRRTNGLIEALCAIAPEFVPSSTLLAFCRK
jgi:FlaA1/EpsC-like NDP-sugar epimerase